MLFITWLIETTYGCNVEFMPNLRKYILSNDMITKMISIAKYRNRADPVHKVLWIVEYFYLYSDNVITSCLGGLIQSKNYLM